MANRFPLLSSPKQLAKHLHSRLPPITTNSISFSTAYPRPQGHGDEGGGVTGYVADAARQGTRKAAEVVESVGLLVRQPWRQWTLHGAPQRKLPRKSERQLLQKLIPTLLTQPSADVLRI